MRPEDILLNEKKWGLVTSPYDNVADIRGKNESFSILDCPFSVPTSQYALAYQKEEEDLATITELLGCN